MMKKTISIVVTAIFIIGLAPTVSADEVNFSQIDFYIDGVPTLNSEWGSVDFTFTGQEPVMYFNLAANGSWQVQNIPVLSIEGEGVNQSISFAFDLGVPSGTDVTSISYGYTFTNTTLGSMPAETGTAVVFDQDVVISSGAGGVAIPPLQPAKPLVGGAAVGAKKHVHANFPNQDCGLSECCPAAVSNSLKFLNKKHNMGLNNNGLSIAKMKTATNWNKEGCWIDPDATRPAGERNAWWEDKKAYMKMNNIPVTTRKIADLSKLAAEIDKGQDIEIQGDWHTAAVVGITDLGGGKYKIVVAHDTDQGNPGGTMTQSIIYNPATKKFEGSPGFFDGSSFRYAVVECPDGVPVRETWKLHQNKYSDFATDLHFKLWQKEDNIDVIGWVVDISHFPRSDSQRGNQPLKWHKRVNNMPGLPKTEDPDNGQHAVDVTADGANIPHCTWVTVKAKFWLTRWNTKRMSGVTWTKATNETKAMPDHGWDVDYPTPDPQNTGQYLHRFTITNDDASDTLCISGLAFDTTMDWYDDLEGINFPSPYANFSLAPGESWSTDITTSGDLVGGHIYFKYAINDDSGIISEDWVDHPVTSPPPPPPVEEVPVPAITPPGFLLALVSLMVLAVIAMKRKR